MLLPTTDAMKNTTRYIQKLMLLFLVSILIFSCSKSKDPIPAPPAELLLGKWYLEKITQPDGNTSLLSTCEKQTNYEFKKDGSLTTVTYSQSGGSDCKALIKALLYQLSADGEKLSIASGPGIIQLPNEILWLTSTTLEYKTPSNLIYTFKR